MFGSLLFQYNGSKLLGNVLYDMQLARKEVDFVSEVFNRKKIMVEFKKIVIFFSFFPYNRCFIDPCGYQSLF